MNIFTEITSVQTVIITVCSLGMSCYKALNCANNEWCKNVYCPEVGSIELTDKCLSTLNYLGHKCFGFGFVLHIIMIYIIDA